MLLPLFIFLAQFAFSYCYTNKTFFIYSNWPLESCDLDDPWNQSKFGGLELPLLEEFIQRAQWNRSEIAYKCICCDQDTIDEFIYQKLDYFLGTFDGWINTPILYDRHPFESSQPYHEINFVAAALYKKPNWIFLKNIDISVLVLLFLTPIILGTCFKFLNSKHPTQYQVSDYLGLVFFQQEIIGRRNISTKIISLALKLVSLVVLSVFSYSLQEAFDDFKTMGGRSMDNQLQGIKIYTEDLTLYRTMATTLMIPMPIGEEWMVYSAMIERLKEHPGQTFLVQKSLLELAMLQICDLYYIGTIFNVLNEVDLGHLTRKELSELESGILDTIEFRKDYFPFYNNSEILLPDEIYCKEKKNTIFRYSLTHIYELWFIYCIGIGFAILHKLKIYLEKKKINEDDSNVLKHKTHQICKKLKSSAGLGCLWLLKYHTSLVFPQLVVKLQRVRQHLLNKPNMIENLKKCRSQTVRYHLFHSRRRFYFKLLVSRFLSAFKNPELKKLLKKKTTNKIALQIQMLLFKKKKKDSLQSSIFTKQYPYMNLVIEKALQESLMKALLLFNVSQFEQSSKIEKYIKKIGFHNQNLIKLSGDSKPKIQISESMHSLLDNLFFTKITRNVFDVLAFRSKKDIQIIRKRSDQINRLIERSLINSTCRMNLNLVGALQYVLRKRKILKKKLILGKPIHNIPQQMSNTPNNLKLQD